MGPSALKGGGILKDDKYLTGWRGWIAKRSSMWSYIPSIGIAPFLLRDISGFSESFPNWSGPINLVPAGLICLFLISLVATIILAYYKSKAAPAINELSSRAERAQELEDLIAENVSEFFNGILVGMTAQLNLRTVDDYRLTLYVPSSDDKLVRAGRYSTNPNYRKVGRKYIPTGEGLVSEAWQSGNAFASDLGEGDKFIENAVTKYNLAERTARNLNMKPRFLAAVRIDQKNNNEPIGVLVFESKKQKQFTKTEIYGKLSTMTVFFESSIPSLREHIPTPEIAKEKGF